MQLIQCHKCGQFDPTWDYAHICNSDIQIKPNTIIQELWNKAAELTAAFPSGQNNSWQTQVNFMDKFAELIVEECRTVVTEVYRNTPLELCGPLLTVDDEIAKHFYGVDL